MIESLKDNTLNRISFHPSRRCSVAGVCLFVLLATVFNASATLSIKSLWPANGATNVCIDSPLRITFDSTAETGDSGWIRIYASDGSLAESIDVSDVAQPRLIGGATITNYTILVSGNTATIFPRPGALDYNRRYHVAVDPEAFAVAGESFAGITDDTAWTFTTKVGGPLAGTTNIVVAADGTGDFCTVQGAVDFLPEGNTRPVLISIRKGIYPEIVHVNDKHNLTFRGEDRKEAVITYANNARLNNTPFRAMFNVLANDITIENLTLSNSTPRGGSQAEALRIDPGQRCVLNGADFFSFQDTLKLTGTVFANDCFIAGDVDYIWGYGTAFFTNCEIKTLKRDGKGYNGYIIQCRNAETNDGCVFVDCRLTAEPGTSNQILARIEVNRFPYSHVAFINCAMGDHIAPVGWIYTPGTNSTETLRFWEYRSTDLSGKELLDVSGRTNISRQIGTEEAARMRDANHVLGGWSPQFQQIERRRATAQIVPAFPGAEGFGARATGGRGGRVIEVTNLNDDGPGSLRHAVEQRGPRTVVFRVSGTIPLKSTLEIRHGDLTIAGQTAPGDGICIRNRTVDLRNVRNLIIRHLRFRPGDTSGEEVDGLTGFGCEDVIIDHCSVSWGVDECLSLYHARNLTVQWCLVSESLWASKHHKGNHGYGGIWGGTNASWHHNLLAHHSSRNPRFARDCLNTDYRNNVIFNWGFNSAYGGERSTINMINNYYKPGPATEKKCLNRILDASMPGSRWYIAGNFVAGFPEISADNWNGGVHQPYAPIEQIRTAEPFPFAPVGTQSAGAAYELVLARAGATLPKRDSVDARVVEEVRSGAAKFGETYGGGGKGIINSQETVGGWPELKSTAPPPDSDHDGMPDDWENRYGLNAYDPGDGARDSDGDGYTNLEEYLNNTDPAVFADYTFTADK